MANTVKRYKLQTTNEIFTFDEKDGKGYQDKAHIVTIDRFTSNYASEFELIDAFKRKNENHGVILKYPVGSIAIPHSTIELLYNQNGVQKESILYSGYRKIADVPLVDLASCDIESEEFLDFYREFKYLVKNDYEFHDFVMNSNYYPTPAKDLFESRLSDPFNNRRLKVLFKNYKLMRKAYQDVISYER